jgi:hopanoid biosynthesis associated RND transporter like protein HpnN
LISTLDEFLGRAIRAWVTAVIQVPVLVITVSVLAAAALAAYAATNLGINTDENDLFSEELPHYALREDFNRAFPSLVDPLVVVVDGDTVDLAHDAANTLAERIASDTERFRGVRQPGGGEFFETHAFLYLEQDELEDLVDNLFAVQPYLAELSRDASLRGFLAMLSDAIEAMVDGDLEGVNLEDVLDRVDDVIAAHLAGRDYQLSWADVITGRDSTPSDRRRFLLVEPVIDFGKLQAAETSLLGLREIVAELGFDGRAGVRVRATGVHPLSYEEMEHLNFQTGIAGAASFVMVGLILMLALGSGRLVLASLLTLLSGLAYTAGFAAGAIGHLNLISVAFAVLFIGLSIDFAIHVCVRFRELSTLGREHDEALVEAAGSVGGSLTLCAATTAIGFYAFVPTDYEGVAELGVIAGTGMFISLITNLTLLPALIARCVPAESIRPERPAPAWTSRALALPVEYSRAILGITAALVVVAVWMLPQVRFDPNPLRVRDPSMPSVEVFNEMLADGDALPWNLHVIARDLDEAQDLAERIEALPTVDFTVTLADYVPDGQEEKLDLLDDAAFVLLPTLARETSRTTPPDADQIAAVVELAGALETLRRAEISPALTSAAEQLSASLATLRAHWTESRDPGTSIAAVETALIGSLPGRLRILRASLVPMPVTLEELPHDLVESMIAGDGRARIEVFPEEDLNDPAALSRYVESIQGIAADAFGDGLVILVSGQVVVRALEQALLTAAALIVLLLFVLWRNAADVLLVAVPLALATLFTGTMSVVVGVPFNFANVIVIPLLLGMGVDTGIHLVHRSRQEKLPGGNLLRTSTARAVLFSSLTTMASFGTLGLSSHLGMATLGRLLALGISLILVCNLVVLPALLRAAGRDR